jgi:hypothetical protein
MKKLLTVLLALTFMFLFGSSSVLFADNSQIFQDGLDATKRGDYETV